MENCRVRIRRIHAADQIVPGARTYIVCGIHDRAPAEGDVAARERRTVVPAHVAPQLVGDRQAVPADAAVCERGHLCGKDRHVAFTARVDADKRVEEKAADHLIRRVARQQWLQRAGRPLDTDAQHLRTLGRAVARLRARGERERETRQEDPARDDESAQGLQLDLRG